MTDIMKLATDYAQACYNLANPDSYDAELAEEARAALQAAIEALQAECAEHKENAIRNARIAVSIRAERDQLQSKLDDAIQSSAHWQHQFTEVQSRLDGMGKGEPVADGDAVPLYRAAINCPHEIDHEQVILKYDPKQPGHNALNQLGRRLVAAVAAPKALAPLTDEQIYNVFAATVEDAEPFSELVGDPIWAEVVEITRAIESAHGIGGTP